MSISAKAKRIVLSRSGGYCGNPGCNADLYPLFDTENIINIEELAHIIGQSKEGPRGDDELALENRDNPENIILLCPTCHTKIDKFPNLYPVQTIRNWKELHENKIKNIFHTPKFSIRNEARKEIERLQITNKMIFDMFGPYSKKAEENFLEAGRIWIQKSINTIIPNNRKIFSIIENNYELLTDKEKPIYEEWKQHKEIFEYNKLSGDKTSALVIYPKSFDSILNG